MKETFRVELIAYEDRGVEAKSFLQGMLNRLTFGKARYEKGGGYSVDHRKAKDMIDTAILSLRVAEDYDVRERLIDAANYCFLAYRRMEDTGSLDGDSPGVVDEGIITKARGRFEHLNGQRFNPNMDTK